MKNAKANVCSVCGKKYIGYGNNAQPINNGRCCDDCNEKKVIPFRLMRYKLGQDMREVREPIKL